MEAYRPQGQLGVATSTYGYNAYYLSPGSTGYRTLRGMSGVRASSIGHPNEVFVFGDAMMILGGVRTNTALLDPPRLWDPRRGWRANAAPTTAFRHDGGTQTARADGSVHRTGGNPAWIIISDEYVGSVGKIEAPHYVPEWPFGR
jgi:hypothetical protein